MCVSVSVSVSVSVCACLCVCACVSFLDLTVLGCSKGRDTTRLECVHTSVRAAIEDQHLSLARHRHLGERHSESKRQDGHLHFDTVWPKPSEC